MAACAVQWIGALQCIGDDDTIAALKRWSSNEHLPVRRAAILVLRNIGNDACVEPLSCRAWFDEEADLRILAIDALASIGTPVAWQAIQYAAADSSAAVRKAAWQSLENADRIA
jgi:HEAT repeat protein